MTSIREIAHLGYVELRTTALRKSMRFFTDLLGMREVYRRGASVYLHSWDDYEQFTLKLTAAETSGCGMVAYRATDEAALLRSVAAIEGAGLGVGWQEGEPGIGATYHFTDPSGHSMAIYWQSEYFVAPDGTSPALANRADRFPGRGVNAGRLDHVDIATKDVEAAGEFVREVLGGRTTDQLRLDSGRLITGWHTFTNKSCDLVYTDALAGADRRVDHVCFSVDTLGEVLRAADLLVDGGVQLAAAPQKHSILHSFFLHAWEPGGNLIELRHPGSRLLLAPDWPVVEWTQSDRRAGHPRPSQLQTVRPERNPRVVA